MTTQQDQFDELMAQIADGAADDTSRRELEALVVESPILADDYVDLMLVASELQRLGPPPRSAFRRRRRAESVARHCG